MKAVLTVAAALSLTAAATMLLPAGAPAVATSAVAATATTLNPNEWKIDNVHSSAIFRVKHLNAAWFYGRFNTMSGSVVLDEQDPSKSSIDITIDVNSVDSNDRRRDGHLRGEDFFLTSEFPSATFKSKAWSRKNDTTWAVTGDLTIRGVTREITVDIEKTGESTTPRFGPRVGLETTFTINRMDFGIKYMPEGLGTDVRLTIAIELMK